MADEIEEFLRRAAQRRQRAQNRRAETPRPARSRSPEYTDSRAERAVREIELIEPDPDEVLTAEIVESPARKEQPEEPGDQENERLAEHLRGVFAQGLGTFKPHEKKAAIETVRQLDPLTAVLRQLKRPGGMAEAVILREILERPTDRW